MEYMSGGAWEPIVGIGMPTYNRERYLRAALDSFLAQTYKNIIVVVCDNASTDGTQKMCEEYMARDKRVRYVRHTKNIGRNGNATFALQQIVAVADLCMMTSDDDLAETEFVEVCVKALRADPNAVMAITAHNWFFWGSDKTIPRYPHRVVPSEKGLYGRLKQYTLFYSHDERSFCMSGFFRKAIVEHERFDDLYECDVNFSLRCLSRGYFLLATERILFHKGTVEDRELTKELPIGIKKIERAVYARFARAASEFRNMAFITTISDLSIWQRIKLIFWNLIVLIRVFTRRRI